MTKYKKRDLKNQMVRLTNIKEYGARENSNVSRLTIRLISYGQAYGPTINVKNVRFQKLMKNMLYGYNYRLLMKLF